MDHEHPDAGPSAEVDQAPERPLRLLVVEEGNPDYVEQAVNTELRRSDIQTRVLGKGMLPKAGEYTSDVLLAGKADAVLAASVFHFGQYTVGDVKRFLAGKGIQVRL